jgi:hypothetical protein
MLQVRPPSDTGLGDGLEVTWCSYRTVIAARARTLPCGGRTRCKPALAASFFQTADENREHQQEADASGRRVLAPTRAGGVDPTQALRATVQELWAGQVSENSISPRIFERYQVGLGSMLL